MGRHCDITDVFVELQRSPSPARAVRLALRMMCEAGGYTAARATSDNGTSGDTDDLSYGPRSDVRRLADGDAADPLDATMDGSARTHVVTIELTLAGRKVGRLRLASRSAVAAPPQDDYVATLPAVIATLLAATNGHAIPMDPRVLGRVQFVEQWGREVSRAARKCQSVSLVLARRAVSGGESTSHPSAGSAADLYVVAGGLVERLRGGDVVGLVAPSILGVLLPDTGRIGAKIAASRMQSMLPWMEGAGGDDEPQTPEWTLAARTYPQDGDDADAVFTSVYAAVCDPQSTIAEKAEHAVTASNRMEPYQS